MLNDLEWETQKNIDHIIDEVAARGWTDAQLQADDFSELRTDARFRDAQLAQLYEQYFLPERHEFEWLVLYEIVRAVAHAPVTQHIASGVALGVAGNAAFVLIRKMCLATAHKFKSKLGANAGERAEGFGNIALDAERIQTFFAHHQRARIDEIERETGIVRERIHPLIKLAGLKHYRRDDACYWEMPTALAQIEADQRLGGD